MQRIASTLTGLSLFFLVIFATGCGEDTPGGGLLDLPPTISLSSDPGFISFDQEVPFGLPTFSVRLNVDDGDAVLRSLAITQDGVNIPSANLTFDGGATGSQNPILLTGGSETGTTFDIDITPVNPVAGGTSIFTFTVTDTENLTASTDLQITFSANPATVTFGAGGLNQDSDVSTLNSAFNIDVEALRGDDDVASVAFLWNGALLDASEVFFAGTADAIPNNPFSVNPQNDLYTGSFTIAPDNVSDGVNTFTVEVADVNGVIGSNTISINYFTPEVTEINGVLFNQGGAAGTGGLDLDNGVGVGSNSPDAEIQDEGINLDITPANNWRRQLSGANGAGLRVVNVAGLPDGGFGGVTTQLQIRNAYEAGAVPSGSDASCNCTDPTSGEQVTQPVVVGDVFSVLRDGTYYLVRIDEVNNITTGNGDNYVVSIKR